MEGAISLEQEGRSQISQLPSVLITKERALPGFVQWDAVILRIPR